MRASPYSSSYVSLTASLSLDHFVIVVHFPPIYCGCFCPKTSSSFSCRAARHLMHDPILSTGNIFIFIFFQVGKMGSMSSGRECQSQNTVSAQNPVMNTVFYQKNVKTSLNIASNRKLGLFRTEEDVRSVAVGRPRHRFKMCHIRHFVRAEESRREEGRERGEHNRGVQRATLSPSSM